MTPAHIKILNGSCHSFCHCQSVYLLTIKIYFTEIFHSKILSKTFETLKASKDVFSIKTMQLFTINKEVSGCSSIGNVHLTLVSSGLDAILLPCIQSQQLVTGGSGVKICSPAQLMMSAASNMNAGGCCCFTPDQQTSRQARALKGRAGVTPRKLPSAPSGHPQHTQHAL